METDFALFDWQRIFIGPHPLPFLGEIALKSLIIFGILLVVLRLVGKRGQQDLSPLQQILLIALGSAAGDAMLYPEISLAYAAAILLGVTLLTVGIEIFAQRSRPVRDYLESHPRILVRHGVIDHEALRKERTTLRELHAELRMHGARSLDQVDYAILEITGDVSVLLNERPVTREDLVEAVLHPASGAASSAANS